LFIFRLRGELLGEKRFSGQALALNWLSESRKGKWRSPQAPVQSVVVAMGLVARHLMWHFIPFI
jgi:hypothetical protein